jgi:hypothetical protein
MGKQGFWAGHLEAIEVMGVSTKEYAEREGLSVHELYAWRAKLKKSGYRPVAPASGAGGQAGQFARVVAASPVTQGDLCIEAGHCSLRFAALPDPAWLGALLRVLQEA